MIFKQYLIMKKVIGIFLFMAFASSSVFAQYKNTTIQVGQDAPELSYPDPNGKTMTLSKITKGRYILLDFWASWCGPCRMANPGLVNLYNEYKGVKFKDAPKGFTVFSVSLDRNSEAWVKAIEKDKLEWPYHVSDLKAWSSEAARTYGVNFIPQAFLIGPDGKIVGVYNSALSAKEELEKRRR